MTQAPPSGEPGNPWQTPPASAPPPGPPPATPPPASAPPAAPPLAGPTPAWPGAPWTTQGWAAPQSLPATDQFPAGAAPGYISGYPPPPRKRRGLLIAVLIAVPLVLLLAGGGTAAYLLTRNPDGKGQPTPQTAAEDFLEAMYVDQDAAKAAPLVCKAARDPKKIAAKVDEIKKQSEQYDNPKYTWTPLTVERSTNSEAVISAKIKLTTDDVQSATQSLKLTLIKSNGWFVCDIGPA